MKRTKLSSRYAKAFFDFAVESGNLDIVFKDMQNIEIVFEQNKDLRQTINSPIIRVDKKAAIMRALFADNINEATFKFLHLIINKGREANIDTICKEFVKLYKKHNNIITLYLTSAQEMDSSTIEDIVSKVKQYVEADIDVKPNVNPELIGGYRLQFDDYSIDASVSGQLKKLHQELVDKSYQINF